MNRRVLVLNQFALPLSSAGGTRHVEVFSRLEGWTPLILAGRKNMHDHGVVENEGPLETVPVTPYRGNGITRVLNWGSYTATAGVAALRNGPFDVVFGSSPHLGAALVGRLLARVWRVPFVLEVRDLWPQILADAGILAETSPVYRALSMLEGWLYREAAAIVVLAEGTTDDIEARGINRNKVHFVPNGADPADFCVNESRDTLREFYGLGDGPVAVYAGAHGPANGLDLLLDAAAELHEQGDDLQIVLVGDGVSKAALLQTATDRSLTNVTFLDPIPKSEIPRLFAAADIGIHCLADIELFHRGVSPNKLYDYMAAGLPVITNTPGEVADLVTNSGAGEAVGPSELAAGLRRLLERSADERTSLGRAGQRFMEAHRSRAATARAIEHLLDSVSER